MEKRPDFLPNLNIFKKKLFLHRLVRNFRGQAHQKVTTNVLHLIHLGGYFRRRVLIAPNWILIVNFTSDQSLDWSHQFGIKFYHFKNDLKWSTCYLHVMYRFLIAILIDSWCTHMVYVVREMQNQWRAWSDSRSQLHLIVLGKYIGYLLNTEKPSWKLIPSILKPMVNTYLSC